MIERNGNDELMAEEDRTDDGRYIVVNGRRWRASDPTIPPRLRQELVSELMAARRQVGAAKRQSDSAAEQSARRRVSDAKTALGERGRPWWEPRDSAAVADRSAAAARTLLRHRAPTSSICPSEIARIVDFDDWRSIASIVRRSVVEMAGDFEVEITRGGTPVDSFDGGPVRIRRGPEFPEAPPALDQAAPGPTT